MLLTNDEVQRTLTSAVNVLRAEITTLNTLGRDLEVLKLSIVMNALLSLQLYSESSNGIPALRGLGTEEGYELAKKILAKEVNPRDYTIHHRKLLSGITFNE